MIHNAGVEQRSARHAHNVEVAGSNPAPDIEGSFQRILVESGEARPPLFNHERKAMPIRRGMLVTCCASAAVIPPTTGASL